MAMDRASRVGIHTTWPWLPRGIRHELDGNGVDAAHGTIECDSAVDFEALDDLRHQVGKRRRMRVVVLEEQPAHAVAAGQTRCFNRVDRSRLAIGSGMDMEVDHAVELRLCRQGRDEQQQRD